MQRRSGRAWTALAPVFAAMILASCAKDLTTGPRIATLVAVSGGAQQAPAGTTLPQPLVVRVQDQTGQPVSGLAVSWDVTSGGGTVTPSQSFSDATGLASTSLLLGPTAGSNTVTASIEGQSPIVFTLTATAPIPIGGGPVSYTAVSAGAKHSCALSVGGVAYCWGYNGDGQLGIGVAPAGSGPVYAFPQPTASTGNITFSRLFGGSYHTCGLTLSGVGQCWGVNVDGRLGIQSFETVNAPTTIVVTQAFGRLSAGQAHTCALDLSGLLFCWGRNVDGQLALADPVVPVLDPTHAAINAPANDPNPANLRSYLAIAAGGIHSCAIAGNPGLDLSGPAWCWGNNYTGQLGNSANGGWSSVPVPVSGGLSFALISAGLEHTCALTASGAAYCWGSGSTGQLGSSGVSQSNVPVAVGGGLLFASISSGQAHTCGITFAGAAYCWGSNSMGQLGDGSTSIRFTPAPVSGGLIFASVSAGANHSCGITTTNVAYCWGDNQFGQLGDLSTIGRLVPTKVAFQP